VSLDEYRRKRDFTRTPEPSGTSAAHTGRQGASIVVAPELATGRFVIQRHRARRLHYDFRLEVDGALASWAVPKGPSLDPSARRAAFRVEDHPLDYYDFEGTIPRGEYGAGDVIVWDWGTFEAEATGDVGQALRDGELKMVLHGQKVRGRFTLVRTRGWSRDGTDDSSGRESWLLIKKRDDAAVEGWNAEGHPYSVKTGRTNDEVALGVVPARDPIATTGPIAVTGQVPERPSRGVAAVGSPAPMPEFIEPMNATLADRPFSNPDWLYELKWDGYRMQIRVEDGRVCLYSRRGLDVADQFPELSGPPDWLAAREAILDGEVVALDGNGRPDFGLLQARNRPGRRRSGGGAGGGDASGHDAAPTIVCEVFDLLYLDGRSLVDVPLEERKRLLRSVVRDSRIRYAGHVVRDGEDFYAAVSRLGLEGMVAKLRGSRYEPGRRSAAWAKVKRRYEQEFVVGGWTGREGAPADLGALLLGIYEDGRLRPVGRVGTGFDARMRHELIASMEPLALPASPFRPVPREPGVHWVEPVIVVRVEFAEWTADGNLRAPSFKGVDPGRNPRGVAREWARPTGEIVAAARGAEGPARAERDIGPVTRAAPEELQSLEALPGSGGPWSIGGRTIKLSNLDKLIWPEEGITKRELIRYYVSVAPYLIPYLAGRALTLRRYPDGVGKSGFWQKQVPGHAPDWIDCWAWESRSRHERVDYMVLDSVAALAWIANEAAIDVHPSTYLVAAPQTPTWALVDIDPGPTTRWDDIVLLARLYRTALEHLGVTGFPKVSGQRGIQVWIPVAHRYTFDETRDWVAALSRTIASAAPGMVSWEWRKTDRGGLARLDYTQNAWNKTLVAPYSVRPTRNAPVSAPITWDELEDAALRPDRWTMATMPARLAERGDLFERSLELAQELPPL
jgi:bifunctional non-homologous end joining protein LigD